MADNTEKRKNLLCRVVRPFLVCAAVASTALADFYHGAGTAVRNVEQWEAETAQQLGLERVGADHGAAIGQGGLQAGDLHKAQEGSRTGTYRRKGGAPIGTLAASQVGALTELLAWLSPENVKESEFPGFDKKRIPAIRESAMRLLAAAGKPAAEAIIQNLVTPPASMDPSIRLVTSHRQDLFYTLQRMAGSGADERISIADVSAWVATVAKSALQEAERRQAMQAIFLLLPLDDLARAVEKPAQVGVQKEVVLAALGKWLRELIHDDPDEFARLRGVHPLIARMCEEILERTDCQALKKTYDKTKSTGALTLLLEKPDVFKALRPKDFQDAAIRDALLALVAKPGYQPQSAAAVVRGLQNPDEAGLKRLFAEGKPWERVGAYHLAFDKLGRSPEGLDWLVDNLGQTPGEYRAAFAALLAERIGGASTESLIKALKLGDDALMGRVAAALAQKAAETEARAMLRRSQSDVVAAFSKQRASLLPLARILGALKTKVTLAALIDGLTDPSADVWHACRDQLCGIHPGGVRLGPANNAGDAERTQAQAHWRAWLETYKEPPP